MRAMVDFLPVRINARWRLHPSRQAIGNVMRYFSLHL
jgi:hypothetical protein